MPYVDRPLPEALVLPVLRERPRDKRLDNLRHSPGQGRPHGSRDKITRDLKEGVLTAAINVGRDGYGTDGLVGFLEDLAAHHKKLFTSLLVKVLPYNLTADVNKSSFSEVRIISVPSDHYFRPDESDLGTLQHTPPVEPIAPPERTASIEPVTDAQAEEEEKIIRDLRDKIAKLTQSAGLVDV